MRAVDWRRGQSWAKNNLQLWDSIRYIFFLDESGMQLDNMFSFRTNVLLDNSTTNFLLKISRMTVNLWIGSRKMPNTPSHKRKIPVKKTVYNEGRLYLHKRSQIIIFGSSFYHFWISVKYFLRQLAKINLNCRIKISLFKSDTQDDG